MGIEIKEPCNEDWSKMTSTERGTFCKACAKEVIDFTGMSSFEIKSQLAVSYSTEKNICGRIRNEQLAEINGDFYAWKSDQERFKTVWIFSLIAVFGLTLFSCQNTLTKEIVSQMETNGAKMIDNEVLELSENLEFEKVEIEDLDETLNDLEVGPDLNFEWVISEGQMMERLQFLSGIDFTLGFMTYPVELAGNIGFDEPPDPRGLSFIDYLDAYFPVSLLPSQLPLLPDQPKINVNPNPIVRQNNQNGVLNSEGDDFEIAIIPLPINDSSRLLIDVKSPITAEISLTHLEGSKTTYSGKKHLPIGKHSIDLNLSGLAKGSYVLEVSSEFNVREIDFNV